ncbi:hypothetical protein Dvul_3079 (plasmid) [Nitratidesulfovibrio vulgaris DP4]|uniref:Uncharacterized protein n=1 Tax=Nitratidesulfovibrio vulgaris (strain DP4) TaxID=391774 RepID=A0A0H3ADW5_NITV4|nr:hypothetical protein Dvul_3079 [Nitratidesulfovibrio vulgaris DP4]
MADPTPCPFHADGARRFAPPHVVHLDDATRVYRLPQRPCRRHATSRVGYLRPYARVAGIRPSHVCGRWLSPGHGEAVRRVASGCALAAHGYAPPL